MFAWLEQHYPGDIVLLHVGFPTPFPVRQQQGQATAGSARHAEAPPPHPHSSYSQAANVAGDARERGVCGRELPAVHGKPTFLVQVGMRSAECLSLPPRATFDWQRDRLQPAAPVLVVRLILSKLPDQHTDKV